MSLNNTHERILSILIIFNFKSSDYITYIYCNIHNAINVCMSTRIVFSVSYRLSRTTKNLGWINKSCISSCLNEWYELSQFHPLVNNMYKIIKVIWNILIRHGTECNGINKNFSVALCHTFSGYLPETAINTTSSPAIEIKSL